MNLEQARFNMIEQQVRPWDVLDDRVLTLLDTVPRERFVPTEYRDFAFADTEVPIGHGQVMLPPRIQARALQALDLRPTDKVLEVGTGTGYLTALLARLGDHVHSIERVPELRETAAVNLEAIGVHNVTLETGNAATGWPAHAPYDVIVVTGSLPELPPTLRHELRADGRLFVIVGEPPVMEARLITRVGEQEWTEDSLFETVVPPLEDAPQPQRFVF